MIIDKLNLIMYGCDELISSFLGLGPFATMLFKYNAIKEGRGSYIKSSISLTGGGVWCLEGAKSAHVILEQPLTERQCHCANTSPTKRKVMEVWEDL